MFHLLVDFDYTVCGILISKTSTAHSKQFQILNIIFGLRYRESRSKQEFLE